MIKWITTLIIILMMSPAALAAEGNLTISDREIIGHLNRLEERLTHLEAGQQAIDSRLIRLEAGQQAIDKRIDDLNRRIDDLRGFLYILLGGMIALIGFVIWDRRSAISPVINRTRDLESDRDRTLKILKEYAQKEPKLAEILKSLGLL